MTEVEYAGNQNYEDSRPFYLTDDTGNESGDYESIQIKFAISTDDFVAIVVDLEGESSFRIFQRFYQVYFSMFFELSNTMNNMQNLGNLYENNTD